MVFGGASIYAQSQDVAVLAFLPLVHRCGVFRHALFPQESTYSAYAGKGFLIAEWGIFKNTLLQVSSNHKRKLS